MIAPLRLRQLHHSVIISMRDPLNGLGDGPAAELLFFWLSRPRDPTVDAYRVTQATVLTICNI
jgi:hypothetical protein